MPKKRIIVLLVLLILGIAAFILGYKYFNRLLGKGVTLNYNKDISEIQLECYDENGHITEINGKKSAYINNKNQINEFIGYINNLALVEEDAEVETVNNDYIHISVLYEGWENSTWEQGDDIFIYRRNLFLFNGPYPFSYNGYYMKNSEYNKIINFVSEFYVSDSGNEKSENDSELLTYSQITYN